MAAPALTKCEGVSKRLSTPSSGNRIHAALHQNLQENQICLTNHQNRRNGVYVCDKAHESASGWPAHCAAFQWRLNVMAIDDPADWQSVCYNGSDTGLVVVDEGLG